MGHILWVEPVFKEMIWGGNQLKEKLWLCYSKWSNRRMLGTFSTSKW